MSNITLKAIFVILALLLYGTAPRSGVLIILGAIILWRITSVVRSGFPPPLSPERIDSLRRTHLEEIALMTDPERARLAGDLGLSSFAGEDRIAEAIIMRDQANIRMQRSRSKMDMLLLPASFVALPLFAVLCLNDIVVLDDRDEWGVLLLIGCALLIHLGIVALVKFNQALSAALAIGLFLVTCWGIPALVVERHPYLNPWAPNRSRLLADHVLQLHDNITAERHASFVFAFADELMARGRLEEALGYYRAGLRLDAESLTAHRQAAALSRKLGYVRSAIQHERSAQSISRNHRPVIFTTKKSLPPLPVVTEIERGRYALLIVPVGAADRTLVEAAGRLVKESLGHPVFLSGQSQPAVGPDRKRGLLSESQISTASIHAAFWHRPAIRLAGPIQVVLVTDADVYMDGANFVFATGFLKDHSCVVSYARFQSGDVDVFASRLAKQILSAAIKAMRVPQADTLDCVTAYVNSLDQFDRKSIRLLPQTRQLYESHIRSFELSQHPVQHDPR